MFDTDLLIALGFMALLFLRHVAILKKPNKINYAPLVIAIGVLASLIHLIIHPNPSDIVLLMRESLMPLVVAMILYIVMNILNQTKESYSAKLHEEFTQALSREVSELKKFILDLESRMTEYSQEDRKTQLEIQEKFKTDVKALEAIQANQMEFAKKFDTIGEWHESVNKSFAYFSEVQLPELDNVVHKHIDILRVAEQDHYNKLTQLLEKVGESRYDIAEEIENLKSSLESMKTLSDTIAKTIVDKTLSKLSALMQEFESKMLTLKLHAEGVETSLYEDESTLTNIRTQSEMIMKQIVLSAQGMEEFQEYNNIVTKTQNSLREIVQEIENIKTDYIKSQAQLGEIVHDFQRERAKEAEGEMVFIKKLQDIEEKLEALGEHYKTSTADMTEHVQLLAKKAQLQKGYGE
ncbi:hypothetical protein [Sulfurimonas paralvinellae]|uniref:Uncharacterized protein n=1 Tax=Sulfurimonas paralvinellae TaxID=317658 RepID=A0A7M1B718_9BACT|nr:hypothetical protein [Sulfurimonas paralvinellae]QOP45539.1 hypothetical protein FM071_04275 [Sulfurimonas paralvinellae]